MKLKEELIEYSKRLGTDIIGFAPIERFSQKSSVKNIMPETRTVIGLGFRVLRGVYRGIEEGSTYYQYPTMGVMNMEETVMPMVQLRLSVFLEEEGYIALPQRRHQRIMSETDSINPEVAYITRGCRNEIQMDFSEAAVACGLGELGLHGALLTDEFGPFVRYCFILTDAIIEPDPPVAPHLCDKCGECIKGCPGHAISEDGKVDLWQCAVYYHGANGTKNPFMPPNALENFENRKGILSGDAQLTKEDARKLLGELCYYPGVEQYYQASICGRACDINCYIHLEKKGVLTKKFKTPFRKREEWKFDINDYLKAEDKND